VRLLDSANNFTEGLIEGLKIINKELLLEMKLYLSGYNLSFDEISD